MWTLMEIKHFKTCRYWNLISCSSGQMHLPINSMRLSVLFPSKQKFCTLFRHTLHPKVQSEISCDCTVYNMYEEFIPAFNNVDLSIVYLQTNHPSLPHTSASKVNIIILIIKPRVDQHNIMNNLSAHAYSQISRVYQFRI